MIDGSCGVAGCCGVLADIVVSGGMVTWTGVCSSSDESFASGPSNHRDAEIHRSGCPGMLNAAARNRSSSWPGMPMPDSASFDLAAFR